MEAGMDTRPTTTVEQDVQDGRSARYVHPKYGPPGPEWSALPSKFRAVKDPFVRLDGNGVAWIFGQFNLSCFLGETPWGEPSVSIKTIGRMVECRNLPQWRNEEGKHTRGNGMAHFAACQVIRWGLDGNWRFDCEDQLGSLLSM